MGLITTYNQYERIIWLHERIRSGLYPNAQSMAHEFEIHKRTCQRVLCYFRGRLQAPLAYSNKNRGYYYTDPNYSLPLAQISQEEILALVLAKNIFFNLILS